MWASWIPSGPTAGEGPVQSWPSWPIQAAVSSVPGIRRLGSAVPPANWMETGFELSSVSVTKKVRPVSTW